MSKGRLLYAQSGGVTAVINASASAVLARARAKKIPVLAGKNGILGILREQLFDTESLSASEIKALAHTPGGAFGSCRYKLKSLEQDFAQYQRLLDVFKAHDIRYFLYNGGNDSADTALKISQLAEQSGYQLTCIAVPKTVDNDLVITDCCPGFGSAARYTAVSVMEAAIDVEAMAETSTKVFVYEVMGRHAGWLAAAAGLAGETVKDAPHIILFPERAFNKAAFMAKVQETVAKVGYCVVVVSEGVKTEDGKFLAQAEGSVDAFGHSQLGGAAPMLAGMVKDELGYKVHWAVPDYMQRSGRHLASQTDLDQAMAVGRAAVDLALAGNNGVLPAIIRTSDEPYAWHIDAVPLSMVANHEKKMPDNFIRKDGFGITPACRRYLSPLIQGQAPVPLGKNGLPIHFKPKLPLVKKKLKAWVK
ncbi:MAG: 6-phosphofructokinase [Arenimonas sp.]|nr:6-phosphofructokinase [Arenimonas sp.]MBP6310058.1 6-phosphofructokinase [Arenimonas sp.]